jgi:GNAT superfamily N-acetyltransferase
MPRLAFRPVTPAQWNDLESLFGPRGACGGCWCMWWRLPRSRFNSGKGEGNRKSLKRLVSAGTVPGILAYDGQKPVGWCSVGPRDEFPVLDRSRVLARVDDQQVWSIVCFFVAKDRRRAGMTGALIAAAVSWARKNGARIVEAYPVEPTGRGMPDAFAYTGLVSAFTAKGFVEAARRSPHRAVYRLRLGAGLRGKVRR